MRSLSYLMKFALITITLYSCNKNETDGNISFNNESRDPKSLTSIASEGDTSLLEFESTSSWRLIYSTDNDITDTTDTTGKTDSKNSSWLKISPNSGGAGHSTITLEVSENSSLESRTTTFYIRSGLGSLSETTFAVTLAQKARKAELTLTESRFKVPQEGDSISIGVISNVDLTIAISENCKDWISQIATKSLESNLLRFNIAASEDGADRNGTIQISAGDITKEIQVFQSFGKILILNQPTYDISHLGGNITAELSANFNFKIQIENSDWITEITDPTTKSLPSHTPIFEIAENIYNNARSSTIIFKSTNEKISDTITIYQTGKEYGYYESANYSKDGEVMTLQTATVGKGINIVLVGDCFSDEEMGTNGKYEQRMREAVEHFFSEEPYKSFRNRYNVYTVKAISSNNIYAKGSQSIFECHFGEGTLITGNHEKVFEYALKAISDKSTKDLTVITILNSPIYAGTCYMYSNNASISYCPIVGYNAERYRQIIVHEAAGHGFAKLADEYFYPKAITEEGKTKYQNLKQLGWYANADITSDPGTIRWAHFLSDDRYKDEVGIYEGCLTYSEGAYRPTNYSVMRENTGGFNAPCREEIFKRIMIQSGDTYHYEDFVAYDAKNRSSNAKAARRTQAAKVDRSKFVPLAPPVIIWSSPEVSKR